MLKICRCFLKSNIWPMKISWKNCCFRRLFPHKWLLSYTSTRPACLHLDRWGVCLLNYLLVLLFFLFFFFHSFQWQHIAVIITTHWFQNNNTHCQFSWFFNRKKLLFLLPNYFFVQVVWVFACLVCTFSIKGQNYGENPPIVMRRC